VPALVTLDDSIEHREIEWFVIELAEKPVGIGFGRIVVSALQV